MAAANPTEHIHLNVLGQDNSVVKFKIRKITQLKKLMDSYCDKVGVTRKTLRFRFDGQQINEEDTPIMHEMDDDDTIEVYHQQHGGGAFY